MSYPFLCLPSKYGNTYPPVDSGSIVHPMGNQHWSSLTNGTQTRMKIFANTTVYADDFCYGFKISNNTISIKYKVNGVEQGPMSHETGYDLPADTVIFGYSVTPEYVDLWTRSDYRDESSEIMYGKRGIYVKLSSFVDWDVSYGPAGNHVDRCILHGYNDNALNIYRVEDSNGIKYRIQVNFSQSIYDDATPLLTPFKGALTSEVISTLSLESIVYAIQQRIEEIDKQLAKTQEEINKMIPELKATINYETSRLYSSR